MRELVAAINTGRPSALKRFVETTAVPRARTPAITDGFQREQMRAYDREHGWDIVAVRVTGPGEATARVRGKLTGQWSTTSVVVDTAPPYLIARIPLNLAWVQPTYEPFPAKATDAERVRELERFMRKLADADAFSGVVLLAKGGRVLFAKAYGDADRALGAPNRVDTKFDIASMTKMFTAVAIAQLASEGRLSLDDTLGKWLPDFRNRAARSKVRIKHLLSHTSGLQDYGESDYRGPVRLNTVQDALHDVELGQKDTLDFEPGTRHAYLNAGFAVLGRIVELASGQDYYEYVPDRVFRPAGMEHTGWPRADFLVPNAARYYWREYDNDERRWRQSVRTARDLRGDAETASRSTAHDLFRFAEALRAGKLVRREYLELFWSPKPELGAPNWGYGFSFERDDRLGRIVGHGGTGGPVSNCLDIFLDSGYTAVILSNYSGGRFAPRAKIQSLLPSVNRNSVR